MKTPKPPQNTKEPPKHRSTGRMLTYAFTVVLLVIIVVAFVGTPALGGVATGARLSFGSYAGRDIVYEPGNYFARQYQDIARRVQQQGTQVTELLVRQIWRAAFERAVFHEAMMVLADDADVSVSTRAVDRAIARWPEFQQDGRFSSSAYQAMPSQARFALRQYLREVLVEQKVQEDLYGAVQTSEAERRFFIEMAGPQRQFRFVQFAFTDFPESEIVNYGERFPGRFRRMDLSVISVGTSEADARRIREQAVARQVSFEDLARAHSRDIYADDGGDMGRVYHYELEPDFENVARVDEIFELEPGEISPVLRTTFGWAIYRADEPAIDPDFTDPNVIAAIRDYLTTFERGLIEDYLSDQARRFAEQARTDGYEAAAAAIGESPQLTEHFPINFGNLPYFGTVGAPANQTFASAAFREDFFRELFSLAEGDVSDPLVIRDSIFVFQVADVRDPDEEDIEFLEFYTPLIVREFTQQQVHRTIIAEDKLVDDFTRGFNRAVLGR
jgi:peptidyl-prolyl cis-trans isomerase D